MAVAEIIDAPTAETARDAEWMRVHNHPAQLAFLTDPSRHRLAVAGIRGGKSEIAAFDVIRHLWRKGHEGMAALVAAPTFRMINRRGGPRPVLKHVAGWWGRRPNGQPAIIALDNKADNFIELTNGSSIQFCYAADPDSMRATEASIAWLDEGALCVEEAWQVLIGRLTQAGSFPHRAWVTTTPRGRNWIYDWSIKDRDNYSYHHWTTYDNPGLRADDLAALEEAYVLGSDWHGQEMLAQFISFVGLVYAGFDDAWVVDKPPSLSSLVRVIAAIDWGVTSPGCILIIGVDSSGTHWILDEAYERGRVTHGFPGSDWLTEYRRLKEQWGVDKGVADPEDANAIKAFRREGELIEAANNARLEGVRQVQSTHAAGKTRVVGPNCPNYLAEKKQYSWRVDRDGNPLTDADPAKGFDHAMDCERYGEMELAGRSKVTTDDFHRPATRGYEAKYA